MAAIQEMEKDYCQQLLAEIATILKVQKKDSDTREFILGACFMGHAFLKTSPSFITDKQLLESITWVALQADKHRDK